MRFFARCGGRGAKGGTEKVRSFVTFFGGWPPLGGWQDLEIEVGLKCKKVSVKRRSSDCDSDWKYKCEPSPLLILLIIL